MRYARWLILLAFFAVPGWAPAVHGAPLAGMTSVLADVGAEASELTEVAVRCGRNAYYKKGFRARNGQWVKGRCVSTKQRRR
jgi:hypothetical protein